VVDQLREEKVHEHHVDLGVRRRERQARRKNEWVKRKSFDHPRAIVDHSLTCESIPDAFVQIPVNA
jgi:hypothetical protein